MVQNGLVIRRARTQAQRSGFRGVTHRSRYPSWPTGTFAAQRVGIASGFRARMYRNPDTGFDVIFVCPAL
jgi:hypothetical protein